MEYYETKGTWKRLFGQWEQTWMLVALLAAKNGKWRIKCRSAAVVIMGLEKNFNRKDYIQLLSCPLHVVFCQVGKWCLSPSYPWSVLSVVGHKWVSLPPVSFSLCPWHCGTFCFAWLYQSLWRMQETLLTEWSTVPHLSFSHCSLICCKLRRSLMAHSTTHPPRSDPVCDPYVCQHRKNPRPNVQMASTIWSMMLSADHHMSPINREAT